MAGDVRLQLDQRDQGDRARAARDAAQLRVGLRRGRGLGLDGGAQPRRGQRRPGPGHARPGRPWGDALVEAVRRGEIHEAAIDRKVARLLRLAARVGRSRVRAPCPRRSRPRTASRSPGRPRAEGTVLLANVGTCRWSRPGCAGSPSSGTTPTPPGPRAAARQPSSREGRQPAGGDHRRPAGRRGHLQPRRRRPAGSRPAAARGDHQPGDGRARHARALPRREREELYREDRFATSWSTSAGPPRSPPLPPPSCR